MIGPVQDTPRAGRSAFRRTSVGPLERTISLSIVGLLVAIGIMVWIAGRNFDPGLYSLRTEALKSTEAPVPERAASEGAKNAAVSEGPVSAAESPGGYEESAPLATAPPAAVNQPLEIPGAKPMGDTEYYSADTLYEKINGRAPAYFEFGFQQLRCRTFSAPDNGYVDVYEYRMDSPVNAFGIFALERDPAGKPLDFAPDGYSGEMGYFFRQGSCYVQVMASDQKPGTLAVAKSVAEQISQSLPADEQGLGARRSLPAQGMVSESVLYTQDNAQGQAFLKEVFQADYDFEGKKLAFFIMVSAPEDAAKAWEAYLAFSGRYGGKAEAMSDIAGAKVFQAVNYGKWKFIYQRGGEVGGVIDAEDPVAAREFLKKVLEGELR